MFTVIFLVSRWAHSTPRCTSAMMSWPYLRWAQPVAPPTSKRKEVVVLTGQLIPRYVTLVRNLAVSQSYATWVSRTFSSRSDDRREASTRSQLSWKAKFKQQYQKRGISRNQRKGTQSVIGHLSQLSHSQVTSLLSVPIPGCYQKQIYNK